MKPIQGEDIEVLREFILLPILLSVFEHDKKKIEAAGVKFVLPYHRVIELSMDRVMKDLLSIRQEMRKRGIKIAGESHDSFSLRYEFLCRGYRDVFEMPREFVKAETEIRMKQYLLP